MSIDTAIGDLAILFNIPPEDAHLRKLRHMIDDTLGDIAEANTAIQEWVSANGNTLPEELLKLLSDLDHAVPA